MSVQYDPIVGGTGGDWHACAKHSCFYAVFCPQCSADKLNLSGQNSELRQMRQFESGATRDSEDDKLDFSGFLSPQALTLFARYMHKNRMQADGQLRASDNWKKGIPLDAYKRSLIRHTIAFWEAYDDGNLEEADEMACAMMFNIQGWLHERMKVGE